MLGGLLGLLGESGLPFVEAPGLGPKALPVSFKVRGQPLKVDLLVPAGAGPPYREVLVPELGAHAVALPYLGYLLEQAEQAVVIGKSQLIPVAVPVPGRFAVHKLAVSSLRAGASSPKAAKDVWQAAVLVAALSAEDDDALEDALRDIPPALWSIARPGAARARDLLRPRHGAAADMLDALARR